MMHLFSMSDFIDTEPKQQRNSYLMLIEYSDPHFFFIILLKVASFSTRGKISKNLWPAFLIAICAKETAWSLTHTFYFFIQSIFSPHRGLKNRLFLHSARYRGLHLKIAGIPFHHRSPYLVIIKRGLTSWIRWHHATEMNTVPSPPLTVFLICHSKVLSWMWNQLQVVFLGNHLKHWRYRKISPMIKNNFLVKVGGKNEF